jgi:hypothetical protein
MVLDLFNLFWKERASHKILAIVSRLRLRILRRFLDGRCAHTMQ